MNLFWPYIHNWWRPALEIFSVAIAIYYLTRFIRRTRGWPVVIGFSVVMLAVFGLARWLNLIVLQQLLAAAYAVFAAAGLIIMIRRAMPR